tara:strand:+ start:574 stop:786 length:213 start_codon:yes stop_codon:yes gene_type:complete
LVASSIDKENHQTWQACTELCFWQIEANCSGLSGAKQSADVINTKTIKNLKLKIFLFTLPKPIGLFAVKV